MKFISTSSLRLTLAFCLLMSAGAMSAQAQNYVYGSSDVVTQNYEVQFQTQDLNGGYNAASVGTDITSTITVNASTPSLQFNSFSVSGVSLPTMTGAQSITLGFGQSDSFDTTVNLSSISFNVTLNQSPVMTLSPANGLPSATYVTNTTGNLVFNSTNATISSVSLNGTYKVQSPTQTVTGTFSDPLQLKQLSILTSPSASYPYYLVTAGYPNSLRLGTMGIFTGTTNYVATGFDFQLGLSQPIFTTVVDGHSVSENLSNFDIGTYQAGGTPFDYTLISTPEPRSLGLALVAGLALAAGLWFRAKKISLTN